MESEKENFRKVITDLLQTLPRISNERDVRKAYREKEGHNINNMVDKLDAGTLYNFLRYQCRDICDVYKNDGEVKVQKLEKAASAETQPKSHKKKNKNAMPKLNYPLVNQNRGTRPNPQGFNKKKYVEESPDSMPETSVAPCSYAAVAYRPAEQLSHFYQQGDTDDEDELPRPSSYYKGSKLSLFADDDLPVQFSEVVSFPPDEKAPKKVKTSPAKPPSVQNPFEFPTLPKQKNAKKETVAEEPKFVYRDYQDDYEDEEHSEEHEPSGTSSSIEEDLYQIPFKRYERINLDDPIFKMVYPEIVTDPQFTFPRPNIKTLASKLLFDAHIMTIRSPWEFWFQYADESLNILMHRMKDFYDEIPDCDLTIPADDLKPGLVVAAKVFETWHRASVTAAPNKNDEVGLFFVDFGSNDTVHISTIRYMVKYFAEDPVKALRGGLAGVCPKNYEESWNPIARQVFFDSVANKKVYASIRSYCQENDTYEMELCEKIANWPSTSEQMIRRGFADREEIEESFPYAVLLSYAARK